MCDLAIIHPHVVDRCSLLAGPRAPLRNLCLAPALVVAMVSTAAVVLLQRMQRRVAQPASRVLRLPQAPLLRARYRYIRARYMPDKTKAFRLARRLHKAEHSAS